MGDEHTILAERPDGKRQLQRLTIILKWIIW
jgi:hypothetical protein